MPLSHANIYTFKGSLNGGPIQRLSFIHDWISGENDIIDTQVEFNPFLYIKKKEVIIVTTIIISFENFDIFIASTELENSIRGNEF